jgi:hypothetical protein
MSTINPCATLVRCECEKIVPVTRHEQQPIFASISQHLGVTRIHRQCRAQFRYLMSLLPQHPRDIRRHIVIAEKPHASAAQFI